MTRIWERSRNKGSALLLLLAIADHAHDDGGGAYPTIGALARKARMCKRSVQVILQKLVESGELEIRVGAGPRGANLYQVKLGSLGGAKIAPPQSLQGVQKLRPGGAESGAGGVQHAAPKPSCKEGTVMNHKQQQQPGTENLAAAAEAEPHSSRHDFGEVRRYCLATKRHATNPGGLARKLWRSGEEDKEIADWLEAEAAREARRAAKPDADPLAEIEREEREQAELEALLRSLPSEEYERLYEQGRREIVERCPAAQGWNQDQLRPPVEAWIKQQLRA